MIRLSKSILNHLEAEAVTKLLLEDGYLGMGVEVAKFEQEIASYLRVPSNNVVCVNTGTSALHLAVESILEAGDEILVPSLTYISSYQAISAARAIPVSCEVYEDTLTIDFEDAARRITHKTKAIMCVHYASNPARVKDLYEFAKKYQLRVIEDAAHAFGCSVQGMKIGSFGDIVCFSFDGIKNITSGEGGAIVSSDEKVLSIVKDARLLAIEKDSNKRYAGQRSWDFDTKRQGYRYHMSNIFAAIGRVQLRKLDTQFAPIRKAVVERYKKLLTENKNIQLQSIIDEVDIIPHIFIIRVLNGKRDELKQELDKQGVPTGLHYKPNHLLSFYGGGTISLPVTEKIYSQLITLPLHPEIQIEEVDQICHIINSYLS